MKSFGDLIYSREKVSGEAVSKVESHAPKIVAPDKVRANEVFEVRISVGPHPNTVEHSIRWIDVYLYEEGRKFNPIHVARITMEPGFVEPEIVLRMKLSRNGCLYVLAYCNQHGVWEVRKEIRVE